jgi:hypothetical protein
MRVILMDTRYFGPGSDTESRPGGNVTARRSPCVASCSRRGSSTRTSPSGDVRVSEPRDSDAERAVTAPSHGGSRALAVARARGPNLNLSESDVHARRPRAVRVDSERAVIPGSSGSRPGRPSHGDSETRRKGPGGCRLGRTRGCECMAPRARVRVTESLARSEPRREDSVRNGGSGAAAVAH